VARRFYARRYAQAVFSIAREKKELERWQSDLDRIAALGKDATVMALFENPKVRFEDKARILSEGLGDISPLALNLVYLLVSRGRLAMIGDIAGEYRRLLDGYHGIERAEVTTAVVLDDKDKARLEEQLGAVVGKKVVVETKVDKSLIGGIVARVGGRLLDGSTLSRLAAMRKALVAGEVR
jgi:F-type H+-transporting ATPase subunit delta